MWGEGSLKTAADLTLKSGIGCVVEEMGRNSPALKAKSGLPRARSL